MSDMIKLANGSEVSVDVFYSWDTRKQDTNLCPNRTRAVITPLGRFNSLISAANAHGVSPELLGYKLKTLTKSNLGYYYEGQNKVLPPKKPRVSSFKGHSHKAESRAKQSDAKYRPIMTPYGFFFNQSEAAQFFKIGRCSMSARMRRSPDLYYLIKD